MPLKLRRTLSMEDLQNASDDEMDVLLSPAQSPEKVVTAAEETAPATPSCNGTSQRERIFPFSLIADESAFRPRPKPNAPPIIVPVEMPDSGDFFLHGPQAPILKIDGSSSVTGDTRTNARDSTTSSPHSYPSIPRSKSVRFEEPDDEEFKDGDCERGSRDRINSVQTQVEHA